MRISQLRLRLQSLGCKPCHEDRLLRAWSQRGSYDRKSSPAAEFFPLAMRNALPSIEAELAELAKLRSAYLDIASPALLRHHANGESVTKEADLGERDKPSITLAGEGANVVPRTPSDDDVARLLVELNDGQLVESVLLPRGGLCVSTQVGCAVGCVFCMSGRDGLVRQLGSAEIVAQVVLARQRRAVSKVVFMGMGEPAHNLDNVLEAIELLGTQGNIGHKNLVLSTVGDVRVFERLMDNVNNTSPPTFSGKMKDSSIPITLHGETDGQSDAHASTGSTRTDVFVESYSVKPALALSLHTTDTALRAKLLPNAPQIAIEELVERAEVYARATRYPVQYQWTLIEGLNDSDLELERIAQLLTGKYAVMNFIPFNDVDGLAYRRPSAERAQQMIDYLKQRGILAKLRDSAGQEIEGACGQLRARAKNIQPHRVLQRR